MFTRYVYQIMSEAESGYCEARSQFNSITDSTILSTQNLKEAKKDIPPSSGVCSKRTLDDTVSTETDTATVVDKGKITI